MRAIKSVIKKIVIHSAEKVNKYRLVSGNRRKIHKIIKGNTALNSLLENEYNEKIDDYWYEKFGITIKKDWHQAYSVVNGIFDEKYIPEDIFYSVIEPSLNFLPFEQAYSDKNMYSSLFKNVKEPNILLRNINAKYYNKDYDSLTFTDGETKFNNLSKEVVVKPSIDSGAGKNVQILTCRDGFFYSDDEKMTLQDLEKEYGQRNFIIQECLEQHDALNDVYPLSLNSIRVITLRLHHKIHVLSTVVRFGNDGEKIDNQAAGGLSCGVNEKGQFNKYAIDRLGKKYYKHPYTNFQFSRGNIPNFESLQEKVINLHSQLKYFNLVSWDIALDKHGNPTLIELNLSDQEINKHQFNNGALFGVHTENVLKQVIHEF